MAFKLKYYYLMIIRLDDKIFISSPFKNVINTKMTKENLIFSQTLYSKFIEINFDLIWARGNRQRRIQKIARSNMGLLTLLRKLKKVWKMCFWNYCFPVQSLPLSFPFFPTFLLWFQLVFLHFLKLSPRRDIRYTSFFWVFLYKFPLLSPRFFFPLRFTCLVLPSFVFL